MNQSNGNVDKRNTFLLAIIILGALILRLFKLGGESLWYDESFSVYVAGQDLISLTQHTAGDIHPPLYYYMLHFWMLITGTSEFSVAFLSLIFGILVIPLTYAVSKRLFNSGIALLAALLVAASPFQLWYSQEVRMYTIAAFLSLLATWFAVRLTEPSNQTGSSAQAREWVPWVGYIISAALSLYLLYYLAFFLVFLNLYVFLAWIVRKRSPKRGAEQPFSIIKWIIAQGAVFVLYLPWLPTAISQVIWPAVPPWRDFVDFGSVITQSWTALSLGQSVVTNNVWPLLILFAVVYFAGLLNCGSRLRGILLFGSVWFPILLIFLISLITPLFFVRYVFIYSPLFFVTLAIGLNRLRTVSAPIFVLILITLGGAFAGSSYAYFTDNTYTADDFRSALKYIEERWHPGDAILLNAGYIYPEAVHYFNDPIDWRGRLADYPKVETPQKDGIVLLETGSIGADNKLGGGNPQADFYPTTIEEAQMDLEVVSQRHSRLWVLRCYDTVTDPPGFIRSWLDQNGIKFEDSSFTGNSVLRVQGYLFSPQKQSTAASPVSFGNKLSLVGNNVSPGAVKAGDKVFVDLDWQPSATIEDVRSYLALVDSNGRIWQQEDVIPVSKLYPSSKWTKGQEVVDERQLRVLPGTPPGNYKIQLGVYGAKSGQLYDVIDAKGVPQGPQITIGEIAVQSPDEKLQPPEMKVKLDQDFGDGIHLLGYNPGVQKAKPGDSIHLEFLWQASGTASPDKKVKLVIRSVDDGKTWLSNESTPVDGRYPVANWKANELVRDQYDLPLPANLPDGNYEIAIGMGSSQKDLYQIAVKGREHSFEIPASIQIKENAALGDEIKLLGLDLKTGDQALVTPGEQIQVTLYWQAEREIDQNYKVFLQLLDGGNKIRGQRDFIPGDGTLPTTSWVKGEVITESTSIQVNKDAPPGQLRLVIGMYEPVTGKRLLISDNSGQVLGDALEVTQIKTN